MGVPLSEFSTYPAMLPAEVAIFKAWALAHGGEFDRFDFNVRVGKGNDPGATFNEAERRNAVMNSQKRIDAVAFDGKQPIIIEVKDRAGASALGELLTYRVLYGETFPGGPLPGMLLVTNSLQPDMDKVFRFFGIPWQIVAPE